MRAGFVSCTISLAVHLVIAAAILSVPLDRVIRHKSIALDFNIIAGYETGDGGPEGEPEKRKGGEVKRVKGGPLPAVAKKAVPAEKPGDMNGITTNTAEAVQDAKKVIEGSDEKGQVSAAGVFRPAGAPSTAGPGASAGGSGGRGVKTLNYSGPGGVDERHFSFIRDRIMQNIVYPERARRMGWEGRVTLSFTVHENGSIDDVRVVSSSGFPVLDENARDSVARTNFKRKVPVRLVVVLPVEYKLK